MSAADKRNLSSTSGIMNVFRVSTFMVILVSMLLLLTRKKVYADNIFFDDFNLVRPGETLILDTPYLPNGKETITASIGDPSILRFNRFIKSNGHIYQISVTGLKRGTTTITLTSNKSSRISTITIQVANYKQYAGVSAKYAGTSKNVIKKITISGNKLVIDGKPMLYTKTGSKSLKKKRRTFKLTKNTYYGVADGGIDVERGAIAKKQAKSAWKAPFLHVFVEGKKVLMYYTSC